MHPVIPLLRKEIAGFTRHRSAIIITFLVPVILITLFGFVFGLNKKDSGPSGIPIVVVNQSTEPSATILVEALRAEKTFKVITENKDAQGGPRPVSEEDARYWLHENYQRFVIIIPKDFTSDDRLGLRLVFLNNPRNEIESMTVNGMLQKTLFSNIRELLSKSLMNRARSFMGAEKFENYNRRMSEVLSDSFGGNKEDIYQRFNKGEYFDVGAGTAGTTAAPVSTPPIDPTLRRLDTPAAPVASAVQSTASTSTKPLASGASTPATTSLSNPPPPTSPTAGMPGMPASTVEEKKASTEDMFSKIIKIDTEQVAGKQVKNPNASRLVGGYAIMFLLFAVSGFSTSFFEEKHSGIFQRLLAGRARRHHILWAKFLFCMILGMGQLACLFLFGHFLYNLQLFDHLLPLFVMSVCASAACASFGMLIASIANNPQAASGMATMLIITMSAIGGAWFPVSFMPEFIQNLAKLTVVYWSVEGFTNILWADYGVLRCLPYIGALLVMTLLAQSFALWRFRKSNMFE